MAHNSARLWTLPLTALLFVNTLLVGLAMRHVGWAGEPETVVAALPAPLEQQQPQPAEDPIVEPPAPEAPVVEGTVTIWDEVTGLAPDWYAGLEPSAVEAICPIAAPRTGGETPLPSAFAPSPTVTPEPRPAINPAESAPTSVEPTIASTSPADVAEVQPAGCPETLVFINPPSSGGVVHFVVDREVVSLAPGELRRLPAKEAVRVQFHRGDDFGDAEHRCQCGVFAFGVGDAGWMLDPVEGQIADRLLKVCRPAPAAIQVELD